MPIRVTIPHELQRKAARWIEDCLKLEAQTQPNISKPTSPLINFHVKPAMDQLIRKTERAQDGESVTLSLNRKQAQGLMDQLDLWGCEKSGLQEVYRNMIPPHEPNGLFQEIHMYIESAANEQDRVDRKKKAEKESRKLITETPPGKQIPLPHDHRPEDQ